MMTMDNIIIGLLVMENRYTGQVTVKESTKIQNEASLHIRNKNGRSGKIKKRVERNY